MTAQAVGCGRSDVAERATRNEELRKEGADAQKGLRSELSKLVIASTAQEPGKKVIWIKRDEKTTHDFEFMGTIASGVQAAAEDKNGVILVTSTLPGKDQTQLVMVQSTNQDKAKELFDAIKAVLAADGKVVKGGGAKGRFMGKVEGKWGKAEDVKVSEIVEKVSTDQPLDTRADSQLSA
jgi:alanyl-tRNA synthetase